MVAEEFWLNIPRELNIADEFVARPAHAHPQRVAIAGEPRAFTYREVEEAVNRAANVLRDWSCQPGERVLIVLPDSLAFIAAFFGVVKIGAIAVPVNSLARTADYSYYLADSGAQIAIVHAGALAEFLQAKSACDLRILAISDAEISDSQKFSPSTLAGSVFNSVETLDWDADWRRASSRCECRPTSANDTAFLLYTSDSGGTPKAAIHRHADMLRTSRGYAHGVLGLRADDLTYSVSKLFFAYGLGNGMYFPFSVGARTLLDPGKPSPERTAQLLKKYRPTILFSVPTFFAALLREAARGLTVDCSSLRMAVSAGETLPAEIFEQFRSTFGVEILDGIGSTEMLHMFLSARPGQARAGSCGCEVPGCDAKILSDDGAEVAHGEVGNLWVRGGGAFAGYWNKPELTARTKKGEWVLTGDKFICDESGFFRYCGRADDMMKVAGMWVSPGEVENALLTHPAVAEAAIVAHAGGNGLIHPAAYVVLKSDVADRSESETVFAQSIREWLRKKLVSYKCPQEIYFVENLPKTATGKIQRFLLRGASH